MEGRMVRPLRHALGDACAKREIEQLARLDGGGAGEAGRAGGSRGWEGKAYEAGVEHEEKSVRRGGGGEPGGEEGEGKRRTALGC
eukprot:748267-Hanusia_phi.AAC.1